MDGMGVCVWMHQGKIVPGRGSQTLASVPVSLVGHGNKEHLRKENGYVSVLMRVNGHWPMGSSDGLVMPNTLVPGQGGGKLKMTKTEFSINPLE